MMQEDTSSSVDFQAPLDVLEENPDVEFKLELDLSTPEGKAKLAKEICALCNHGGGWIVLGRKDDGHYPDELPSVLKGLTRDKINDVVSTYLAPAQHCTLRYLRPENVNFDVPIIHVPGVGTVPVCGKKNGPEDNRKRIVGIQRGVFYTRTAGPKSAPIDSSDQWQDVVRRCVLSDKTLLLGALATMMQQPSAAVSNGNNALDAQFDAMIKHWQDIAKNPSNEVDPSKKFIAFGFEFLGAPDQHSLSTEEIMPTLQKRFSRPPGPHKFFNEHTSAGNGSYVLEIEGVDGLQVDAVDNGSDGIRDLPYAWRLAENFTGIEIATFYEDSEWAKDRIEDQYGRTWERGRNFWPEVQIAYIDDFLWNVRHLSKAFGFVGQVRVRAAYRGLSGRRLDSASQSVYYDVANTSKQDYVNVDLIFELDALEDPVRSSAVASIAQSVNKFFQGPEITTAYVVRTLNPNRSF